MTATLAFIQFFSLIALSYVLSYQIMHGLARVSGKYILLRLILLPGVIIHELAHALACLVTATPIERISFWNETGGSVVHQKPKFSFITQPLISFAPLPVGLVTLLYLSQYVTSYPWFITTGAVFLMVSIAGTLAPSKTDVIHAVEGSLVILAVSIATYVYFPSIILDLEPNIKQFNNQMLIIVFILGSIWSSLFLLHATIRRIAR